MTKPKISRDPNSPRPKIEKGRSNNPKPFMKSETPKPVKDSPAKAHFARDRNGDYEMIFSFKQVPVSDAFIENMAVRLVDWALDPDSLVLGEFLEMNRISAVSWKTWRARNVMASQAHAFALQCLAVHREVGGLKKRLDSNLVQRSMPMYDEGWAKLNEWYAKMKDAQGVQGASIKVYMNPIGLEEEDDKSRSS